MVMHIDNVLVGANAAGSIVFLVCVIIATRWMIKNPGSAQFGIPEMTVLIHIFIFTLATTVRFALATCPSIYIRCSDADRYTMFWAMWSLGCRLHVGVTIATYYLAVRRGKRVK